MKTNLDSFIDKNRDRLDIDQPDDERIWKGITGRMDQRKRILRIWIRVAASVLLFIAMGTGIILLQWSHRDPLAGQHLLANISPELARQDSSYRIAVNQQLETVEAAGINRKEWKNLRLDLEQLDDQYSTYLADMQVLGDQPKIVNGIIRCYEKKLRIIDKTLYEINKTKNNENPY
ncbi:MAG: hypothetical protein V2A67_11655 [Bacteroidota bacterium]